MGEPTVRIVPATVELARAMAPRMRGADAREVAASGGYAPLAALLDALEASELAAAALFDGEVACMWGVQPIRVSVVEGRIGAAWLLTTDLVERHPRAFWRACKPQVRRLFEFYDVLLNAIDARHEQAVRWASRLGFPLEAAAPLGVEGRPFHVFRVRKGDLHV